MISLPLGWLALVLATPTGQLSANEGGKVVLLVSAPGRHAPSLRTSDLLESGRRAFSKRTGLRLVSPEEAGAAEDQLADCATDRLYGCWARVVGSALVDGASPRFLLIVTVLSLPEGVELSVVWLDGELAQRLLARHREDPEALEGALYEAAQHLPPRVLAAEGGPGLDGAMDALVDELRPSIDAAGLGAPLGRLSIDNQGGPARWAIDGRSMPELATGSTLVDELRTGDRAVTIEREAGATERFSISVVSGQESRLALHAPESIRGASTVELVTAGALGAVGTGLLIWAARQSAGGPAGACAEGGDGSTACPTSWSPRLFGAPDAPGGGADFDGRGPSLVALGLGMLVGGATLAGGFAFLPICDDRPQLCWAAAFLLMGASYGLTEVMSP